MPIAFRLVPTLALVALTGRPAADDAAIHGHVLLPDAGSPLGLRAHVRVGAAADWVDVGADGRFTIRLEHLSRDSVTIGIDAAPGTERRYHPAVVRLRIRAGSSPPAVHPDHGSGPQPLSWDVDPPPRDSIRIVLVPTSFTIRGGTYHGTTVPISIDAAMGDSHRRSPFWRVSRTDEGYGTPVAWSELAFALPVVFGPGPRAPSADDTAHFWAAARRLERDVGRRLFRPARSDLSAGEAGQVVVRIDPGSHAAAMTFVTWDNWGTMHQASIELRAAALLRNERIVSHELMHALGVSHAPWHPSVTGAPYRAAAHATATDVAYTQLLYLMRDAHVTGRATHGILAARETGGYLLPAPDSLSALRAGEPSTIPWR